MLKERMFVTIKKGEFVGTFPCVLIGNKHSTNKMSECFRKCALQVTLLRCQDASGKLLKRERYVTRNNSWKPWSESERRSWWARAKITQSYLLQKDRRSSGLLMILALAYKSHILKIASKRSVANMEGNNIFILKDIILLSNQNQREEDVREFGKESWREGKNPAIGYLEPRRVVNSFLLVYKLGLG